MTYRSLARDEALARAAHPLRAVFALAFVTACAWLLPARAFAAWPASSTTNLAVCTARQSQIYRNAVTDGDGGMILAWADTRSDTADIYVQLVDAGGTLRWGASGLRVCGAQRDQDQPMATSDGAGGAIIVWRDFRSGATGDLYAQHVDKFGALLWPANGLAICTAPDEQANPVIVSDGAGGAIIAWEDWRANTRIYAQRVTGAGVTKWRAQGLPLSLATAPMFQPNAVPDHSGGVYVAWLQQGGTNYDLYGQHVLADSTIAWGTNGSAVCTAAGDQLQPVLALAGTSAGQASDGVLVAWQDRRGAAADIYAQRFTYYGFAYWTTNGLPVCAASGDQTDPVVAADTSGGATVAWHDTRGGVEDIYAQHYNASGTALWATNGIVVCNATNAQAFPSIASDGQGGAIVAWEDSRSGALDIYAQRLNGAGTRRWTANGLAVSTAAGNQYQASIVTSPDTIAVVVWQDQRSNGSDLYAQRIPFTVTLDAPLAPEAAALRLSSGPEPARERVTLSWAQPQAGRVTLALFDASGRRVRALANGASEAGAHAVAWDGRDDDGRALPAGAYFARLELAGLPPAVHRITLRR